MVNTHYTINIKKMELRIKNNAHCRKTTIWYYHMQFIPLHFFQTLPTFCPTSLPQRRLHTITRSHNNMGYYNATNITAITTAMQLGRVTIKIWLTFPGKIALPASAQYCTTKHSDTSELQNRVFTQTRACVTKIKPHICCNIAFHCCRPLVHIVACHGIRCPATGRIGH